MKPKLNKEDIIIYIFLILILTLVEIMIVLEGEMPKEIKIICSLVFLPIIIIVSIQIIKDLILRKKWEKNKTLKVKEKEEIISYEEWNYNQRFKFPNKKNIYDEKIDNVLGEKRNFVKKTDKYGNVILKNRNYNILDWSACFIFGILSNIIGIVAFFNNETNLIALLMILVIFVPLTIYSIVQIKNIKKLKIKISFFQIIKFIFMLSLIIGLFGGFIFAKLGINIEKIIIYYFPMMILIGIIAFVYQKILVIIAKK